MIKGKFVGTIWFPTDQVFAVERTDIGDPAGPFDVTIPAGEYVLSGDDTSTDLAYVMKTLVWAAFVGGEMDSFEVNISDAGIVSLNTSGTDTATITWSDTALPAALRFSGATALVTSVPLSGSRAARGLYYLHLGTVSETMPSTKVASQSEADDGSKETIYIAQKKRLELGIRLEGPQRSASYNEFDNLQEFWEEVISKGVAFRWYPDKTVTTAWARVTNPWGYEVWVADGPPDMIPTPLQQNYYGFFDYIFTATKDS